MGGGEWFGDAEMHDVEYRICEAVEGKIVPGCSRRCTAILSKIRKQDPRCEMEWCNYSCSGAVIVEYAVEYAVVSSPSTLPSMDENVPQI